jgi:hypothetical protein
MSVRQIAIVVGTLLLVVSGCGDEPGREGRVIRIDYQDAEIENGDWVQIDSFRFEHIGRREEAKDVRYPLPSNEVFVDSMSGREFSRDYNPKVVPLYIAKHLDRINEGLPDQKQFSIPNYALLSYRGILEVVKTDSSTIRVKKSEGYDPGIEVVE